MNSRIIEINENTELEIIQDTSFGYAGEVWDAALVLSHFLINKNSTHKISLEGKVVLELGAGTGICGLIAATLNAKRVYISDKEENLDIIKKNYDYNKDKILKINPNAEVVIVPVDWSKKENWEVIKEKIDVIICSDLVWNVKYFDDLINTLDYFCTPLKTEIIQSYQYRQKSDIDFFNKMKENKIWQIERVPDSWLDEEYKAEDIFIVLIKKVE